MNRFIITLVLAAGLYMPVIVTAQDKENAEDEGAPKITLKVGDFAPVLAPGKWIKGEPVKSFEKGKVYIVEFWATWCPPCRAAIPHLSAVQAKYKDKGVVVIGQNVSDNPEKVPAFVEKMGTNMNYRVAVDNLTNEKTGVMNKTWMEASGQAGIPTTFLVGKDGKLVWIGHPSQLEGVLEQVLAGTYDPVKQAELAAKQRKLERELGAALGARDFDKAMKLADEVSALSPHMAKEVVGLKFQILLEKQDYGAAYKVGAQLLEVYRDEAEALNAIAWMIATEESLQKRDLDLAEKMGLRASEVTKGNVSSILDTVAKVYAVKGDYAKAVEWETKALAKSGAEEKQEIQKSLESYKAKLKH